MMQAQALTLVFLQFTQISNANAYTMCVNRLEFRRTILRLNLHLKAVTLRK